MDTDELRDGIWDFLFKSKSSKPIDEIAVLTESDVETVRAAVNHEWFTISQNRVSIAYAPPAHIHNEM